MIKPSMTQICIHTGLWLVSYLDWRALISVLPKTISLLATTVKTENSMTFQLCGYHSRLDPAAGLGSFFVFAVHSASFTQEVVFSDGAGFEPRTQSIRRGRSIHSANPIWTGLGFNYPLFSSHSTFLYRKVECDAKDFCYRFQIVLWRGQWNS